MGEALEIKQLTICRANNGYLINGIKVPLKEVSSSGYNLSNDVDGVFVFATLASALEFLQVGFERAEQA